MPETPDFNYEVLGQQAHETHDALMHGVLAGLAHRSEVERQVFQAQQAAEQRGFLQAQQERQHGFQLGVLAKEQAFAEPLQNARLGAMSPPQVSGYTPEGANALASMNPSSAPAEGQTRPMAGTYPHVLQPNEVQADVETRAQKLSSATGRPAEKFRPYLKLAQPAKDPYDWHRDPKYLAHLEHLARLRASAGGSGELMTYLNIIEHGVQRQASAEESRRKLAEMMPKQYVDAERRAASQRFEELTPDEEQAAAEKGARAALAYLGENAKEPVQPPSPPDTRILASLRAPLPKPRQENTFQEQLDAALRKPMDFDAMRQAEEMGAAHTLTHAPRGASKGGRGASVNVDITGAKPDDALAQAASWITKHTPKTREQADADALAFARQMHANEWDDEGEDKHDAWKREAAEILGQAHVRARGKKPKAK